MLIVTNKNKNSTRQPTKKITSHDKRIIQEYTKIEDIMLEN